MDNTENFVEEIKNKLLNVKLMSRNDLKHSYDKDEDDKYFKIVKFGNGYESCGIYYYDIVCEINRWGDPKQMDMKIDFDEDGYFHMYGNYKLIEYCGKIDINF